MKCENINCQYDYDDSSILLIKCKSCESTTHDLCKKETEWIISELKDDTILAYCPQ